MSKNVTENQYGICESCTHNDEPNSYQKYCNDCISVTNKSPAIMCGIPVGSCLGYSHENYKRR